MFTTKSAVAVGRTKAGDVVDPSAPSAGSITLRGVAVPLDGDVGREFVLDCTRHIEGLKSEADTKTKWGLTDARWVELATNCALLDLVRRERERRVANGLAAREAAQQQFAKVPSVLGSILNDGTVSPRHRIEAARELRHVAGPEAADHRETERFTVVINLGNAKPFRFETEIEHPQQQVVEDGE
jgi:hypothetical protein